MKNSRILFNDFYGKISEGFGFEANHTLVEYINNKNISGNALDLGCGNGRNSIFLAGSGMNVTAVDFSEEGLKILDNYKNKNLLDNRIETVLADINTWEFPYESYDLICAVTILDHLSDSDISRMIQKMHSALKSNGVVYAKVHTNADPGHDSSGTNASKLSPAIRHYFGKNELGKLFETHFKTKKYREFKAWDDTHGKPHEHSFAEIIAEKMKMGGKQ